jgi:hypothetical protein
VRTQGIAILPSLEKHHPLPILCIDVNRVVQASGFEPRTPHVLQAQLEHALEAVGTGLDAAGDDDH